MRVVAETLNRAAGTEEALTNTLSLCANLLAFQTGWVWLRDDRTSKFYLAASHNLPPYLQEPIRMTGSICWCLESLLDGDFSSTNVDAIECSRLRPAVHQRLTKQTRGIAYHASIALRFGKRDFGIMNLTKPRFHKVTKRELELLGTVADQLGIALERARLAEQATRVARLQARTELARDLHDTFAQDLTAIALQLETALQYQQRDPHQAESRVLRALDVARASVGRARRSVEALRDGSQDEPFDVAIRSMTRAFTSQTGIPVHLEIAATSIDPRVEAALVRITNEALANVRRHARAASVTIAVRRSRARIALTIRDDGVGYKPVRDGAAHYGIEGMRERVAELDGDFDIRSHRGGGTQVRAIFPAVGS